MMAGVVAAVALKLEFTEGNEQLEQEWARFVVEMGSVVDVLVLLVAEVE